MKKVFLSFLFLMMICFVAGCSTNNNKELENQIKELEDKIAELEKENASLKDALEESESKLEEVEKNKYSISVIDIDGEKLGEKSVYLDAYDSVWSALQANFDVDYSISDYGVYLSSINGSIVDNNYYLAIYENGQSASTGVEGLVADAQDKFEFRVECWNTVASGYGVLDEYDLLVDKVIYHYAKEYIKESFKDLKAESLGAFWDFISFNLMAKNGYDSDLFNFNNLNSEYIDYIKNYNVSELSGANLGKYYYIARTLLEDMSSFKTHYEQQVANLSTEYTDYLTPFVISPAYSLNITNEKINQLIQTDHLANTLMGIDALAWQVSSLQLFGKYDASILANFTAKDYGNGTSQALAISTYLALGENVRDSKYELDSKDLIEILFDTYYDEELNIIKVFTDDKTVNMSTSQIYTALMAYKVSRDYGKSTNIFA